MMTRCVLNMKRHIGLGEKILAGITPIIQQLADAEVESLAEHLAEDLEIDKSVILRSLRVYYGKSKVDKKELTVSYHGKPLKIITDYSVKGIAICGKDIKSLEPMLRDLGYPSQSNHVDIGKCWVISRKRETEFLSFLDSKEIPYKTCTIDKA